MERTNTQTIPQTAQPQPGADRHPAACVPTDGACRRTRPQAAAAWLVGQVKRLGWPLCLFWLILAQSTRWATPWVSVASWALFAVLAVWWLLVTHGGAIHVVTRSPLSPIVAAAALSAWVNGGDWMRVADLVLYAVALAWMIEQRPDMDAALRTVGRWIVVICLVEGAYLVQTRFLSETGFVGVHLLGNSNVIAAALCVVLPLQGGVWLALAVVALLATGSRAGLAGLCVWLATKWSAVRIKRWWVWPVAGLACLALIALRPAGSLLRIAFWQEAMREFVAHPLFGVGPGMYRYGEWMHAHNIALTWLAETGLVGLSGLFLVTRRGQIAPARLTQVSPILLIAPFFLVDDQTMFWFSSLGLLYWLSKHVTTNRKMPLPGRIGGVKLEA